RRRARQAPAGLDVVEQPRQHEHESGRLRVAARQHRLRRPGLLHEPLEQATGRAARSLCAGHPAQGPCRRLAEQPLLHGGRRLRLVEAGGDRMLDERHPLHVARAAVHVPGDRPEAAPRVERAARVGERPDTLGRFP
ncbi:MAG: hypothetical protein ACK55I_24020, partial [bacterium]